MTALGAKLCVTALLLAPSTVLANSQSRSLRIINESGFKVDIYWINRWKHDELVKNSEEGVFHGAETQINSYITHEFEVHEIPNSRTGSCKEVECKKGYFQVNENDEQLVIFKENLSEIVHTDNVSKAKEQASNVLKECKARALEGLGNSDGSAEEVMNALMSCIDTSVEEAVAQKQDEIDFQQNLRTRLGSKLTTYACVDEHMKMSESVENKTWSGWSYGPRKVQVMMDRGPTKIHYVEDFLEHGDCDALEKDIEYKDVEGKNGLYAQQGSISIDWKIKKSAAAKIASKMYKYAADQNHLTYQADESELMFLEKFNGSTENPPRQDPHCEGICDGSEWKSGDRVATMIAFCEIATKGNATNFPNAGVHIYPQPRSAILINYVDPKKGVTDDGFTKVSACGVTEGTNKVIRHSLRYH